MLTYSQIIAEIPPYAGVSIKELMNPPPYFAPPVTRANKLSRESEDDGLPKIANHRLKARVAKYSAVMKGKGWLTESSVCKRLGVTAGLSRGALLLLVETYHVERKMKDDRVVFRWL